MAKYIKSSEKENRKLRTMYKTISMKFFMQNTIKNKNKVMKKKNS